MDTHLEEGWVVNGASTEAKGTSDESSKEANEDEGAQIGPLVEWVCLQVVDTILDLDCLLTLVDLDGEDSHSDTGQQQDGNKTPVSHRALFDADWRIVGRGWLEKVDGDHDTDHDDDKEKLVWLPWS